MNAAIPAPGDRLCTQEECLHSSDVCREIAEELYLRGDYQQSVAMLRLAGWWVMGFDFQRCKLIMKAAVNVIEHAKAVAKASQ